jgi:hypothetical protein
LSPYSPRELLKAVVRFSRICPIAASDKVLLTVDLPSRIFIYWSREFSLHYVDGPMLSVSRDEHGHPANSFSIRPFTEIE